MPKQIKILTISFTILVLAALIYYWGVNPLIIKAVNTTKQVRLAENRLKLIKTKVKSLPKLEQTLRKAKEAEQAFERSIPAKLTLAELYQRIDSLARQSKLRIKQISADQTFIPYQKDHHLMYIPICIEGTAYFQEIINFMDLTANSQPLLLVEKFDLNSITKGSKPRIYFKIIINAFEYSADSI